MAILFYLSYSFYETNLYYFLMPFFFPFLLKDLKIMKILKRHYFYYGLLCLEFIICLSIIINHYYGYIINRVSVRVLNFLFICN